MVKSVAAGLSDRLAQAYMHACLAEVEAIKPGNVHIFADGHGMVVSDFIQSAEASAQVIAMPNLTLGERVYRAVEATWQAVGMNTNLGIVLLCAPMVHAMMHSTKTTLHAKITEVLAYTTQADAEQVFAAIRIAHPAGLGDSSAHDVHQTADCTLLEAMQYAAPRDAIAKQYSQAYSDIFTIGLPCYRQHLARWGRPAWATTAMYLQWLVQFNDSHVQRKFGLEVAKSLQTLARPHFSAFSAQENPKLYLTNLLAFDEQLKAMDINPGTSADLTVATLLSASLLNVKDN